MSFLLVTIKKIAYVAERSFSSIRSQLVMLELVISSKLIKVNDVIIAQEVRYLSQMIKGIPLGLYFKFVVKYLKDKITALYFERCKSNLNQILEMKSIYIYIYIN